LKETWIILMKIETIREYALNTMINLQFVEFS